MSVMLNSLVSQPKNVILFRTKNNIVIYDKTPSFIVFTPFHNCINGKKGQKLTKKIFVSKPFGLFIILFWWRGKIYWLAWVAGKRSQRKEMGKWGKEGKSGKKVTDYKFLAYL